ncbi:thiamine-monophosphate kinase [Psychromonas sp. CNPT3]|uniref:thiamine-phosphate kinase n=1 Tax=Psychromonas sp. CNPT3 TaxID=314282 RepID=UPI00006E5373|nr:thiamine-phosphate kinase [Psychromonas sp. CNPT3]AGH81558.1 thiamine-monophosphate kinase [Psychromonas sp. CNPT3]
MSLSEFDVIKKYFCRDVSTEDSTVVLGIGDDCAILDVPEGHQLLISTDTLVAGIHFFEDVDAYRLGYKALAVNLSDLSAMGAEPKWISLAITLPNVDADWLARFSNGFFDLAAKHNVTLIGGDTTKGPLSITVSVQGIVPKNTALLRSQAKVGDIICVSGSLGDGALGLAYQLSNKSLKLANAQAFVDKLELTDPRVKLGLLLRGMAHSCIDISDGLTQDLTHILNASHCCAQIDVETLPLSEALQQELDLGNIKGEQALHYALTGGDDYELLFTLPEEMFGSLQQSIPELRLTAVGKVIAPQASKIQLTKHKKAFSLTLSGWDHFKKDGE